MFQEPVGISLDNLKNPEDHSHGKLGIQERSLSGACI